MSRVFKRIVVLAVYILVFSGLIYGAKSLLFKPPAPTCFDKIQNQGETGIDCGGPCQPCPQEILPLRVIDAQAIATAEGRYDIFARVKNDNEDYGIVDLRYNFVLFGPNREIIKRIPGKSFILPQEEKFLIAQAIASPDKVQNVKIQFLSFNWRKLDNFIAPQLVVRNKKFQFVYTSGSETARLTGILDNRSNFSFDKVLLVCVLADEQGRVRAINSTEVHTLSAWQTGQLPDYSRYFQMSWYYPLPRINLRAEVYPYTNVFLNANYLRVHGSPSGG